MRRVFSRRDVFDTLKNHLVAVLKLQCGHEIERPWSTAPKYSVACEFCLEAEAVRDAEIAAAADLDAPPYSVAFKLNGLPSGQQSTGRNRFAIAKERKMWHRAVWFSARLKLPPAPLLFVHATYTRHSSVEIDPTNLAWSFKAVEDGLVEVGVLRDDGPSTYVGGRPDYTWERAAPGRGFVTINITEERMRPHGPEEEQLEEDELDHPLRQRIEEDRVAR